MCADTLGGGLYLALPFDPISLVLAQRNGVEPPKKSAFLPRWLHHPRERYQSVDYTFLARLGEGLGGYLSGCLRRGRTGFVMAALRGWSIARASLSLSASAYHQKRVSLGLHPVSLRKSKEMGWNRQWGPQSTSQQNGAHVQSERHGGLVIGLSTCAPIRWVVDGTFLARLVWDGAGRGMGAARAAQDPAQIFLSPVASVRTFGI